MTTTRVMRVGTKEVARLIGASPRQLDYWARNQWVHIAHRPGSGSPRRWTPEAIQHAAIVAQLVEELGITPPMASRLADKAVSNTGRAWSVEFGGVLLIGRMTYVPEPPEDPET